MPVYTFRCRKCEEEVEVEHGYREPHPTEHVGCGGELVRQFKAPDVVYKGSGFFTTVRRLDPQE